VKPQQQFAQQHIVSEIERHHVNAFFTKTIDDNKIYVHAKLPAQMMQRTVLNLGFGLQFSIHPQPTIDDLHNSIALGRQRNVRMQHLAGHGMKK